MPLLIRFCLLTIFYTTCAISSEQDYYWKDYDGEIPSDAFPAGKDDNTTYIGQAYLHEHGIYVVQIVPGVLSVDIPSYGVKSTSKLIKIFCTKHPEKLSWIPTTAKTYHGDVTGTGLNSVLGGSDERRSNAGRLTIGRITYRGILKVGEIADYDMENAYLYFPHGCTEHKAVTYEALVYNHSYVNPEVDSHRIL